MSPAIYLQVMPEAVLPDVSGLAPFRAVIIAEAQVSPEWQFAVSAWLVRSGCLYTMAWGMGSSSWDDSVDMANLERFEFKDIPEDSSVMTTWHDDETLDEVFRFCKNNASHPTIALKNTLLLHIATERREYETMSSYVDA